MLTDSSIVSRKRIPTPAHSGYQAIIENIKNLVIDLEKEVSKTCLVGICTPGSISSATNCLKNSNTVVMNGKPIKDDLESALAREIRIENDANCFALSEALDGAGKNYHLVFGVIMGTGVGGGIVHHKELHRGQHHIAGEWGHNILEPDGPQCYCGKRGCIETFLSGPSLIKDWSDNDSSGESPIHTQELVKRALQGDTHAQKVLDRFIDRFGRALSTVVNILDPDVIVLGGGLSNLDILYQQGPLALRKHVFNDELSTPILKNQLGDSSGVRGAAQLWPPSDSDKNC